jgi:hypothetical protein
MSTTINLRDQIAAENLTPRRPNVTPSWATAAISEFSSPTSSRLDSAEWTARLGIETSGYVK